MSVITREMLLDRSKNWTPPPPGENESLSREQGVLDLESVTMHQIGHLLGLDHSNEMDSFMYPYILPSQKRKVELSDSDKHTILLQYTNNVNSGCDGGRWEVLLINHFVSCICLCSAFVLAS